MNGLGISLRASALVALALVSGLAHARPFRLGVLSLNDVLNQQKPLALIENAGWTINSGVLVGAFDDRWVGGMSLATRKVQWWVDGGADLTAPPGSFGSSVVLGFRDGKVMKVDALTGAAQWTATLDSLVARPFLLNGTTLYVMTAAQVIYGIDFQTGRTLWLFDGGFPDGLTVRGGARPIVHDGKVIVGLASGELLALTADGGKLVWRYNPAYTEARFHDVIGEMAVRNGRLLITRYDGLVAAIDLAGSVRAVTWQDQLPGAATSLLHDGRYYVGGINGDVYAYDVDTGRRFFRTVTDASVMTMAASENVVYAAGAGGRITALDAGSGAIVWHDAVGGAIATAPLIHENAIYFATGLKNIYTYRLPGR